MSDSVGGTPPPRRKGSGGRWAIAMVLLAIACLVLPILLIRTAMQRVRSLGGTAESALIARRTYTGCPGMTERNMKPITLQNYAHNKWIAKGSILS